MQVSYIAGLEANFINKLLLQIQLMLIKKIKLFRKINKFNLIIKYKIYLNLNLEWPKLDNNKCKMFQI